MGGWDIAVLVSTYNMFIVKFCEAYSKTSHRTPTAAGVAPAPHFCSIIIGEVFMVVMNLVVGRDAYHEPPLSCLNCVG